MAKLNEKNKMVFDFVKAHENDPITSADIAEATGLPKKSVDGIITMTFCRKKDAEKNITPLMERIPAEVEVAGADGEMEKKVVKFIKLTDLGRAFNPDAE